MQIHSSSKPMLLSPLAPCLTRSKRSLSANFDYCDYCKNETNTSIVIRSCFYIPLSPTSTSKHPTRLVFFLLVQLCFPFSCCFFLDRGPGSGCYDSALLCLTLRSWLFYCLSLHWLLLSLPGPDPLRLL